MLDFTMCVKSLVRIEGAMLRGAGPSIVVIEFRRIQEGGPVVFLVIIVRS